MVGAIPCWVFRGVDAEGKEGEYGVYVLDTELPAPDEIRAADVKALFGALISLIDRLGQKRKVVLVSPVTPSFDLAKVALALRDWIREHKVDLSITYDAPGDDYVLLLGSGALSIHVDHRDPSDYKCRTRPLNEKEIAEFRKILQST